MRNAISASTHDPRFPPVRKDELSSLVYSVDVLSPARPVSDKSMLDVLRYGVIVTSGCRRGLLLPNLEGVDTMYIDLKSFRPAFYREIAAVWRMCGAQSNLPHPTVMWK